MRFKYRRSYNCLIAFAATLILFLIICSVYGLAPFGARSLGTASEYDIFEYIRAVADGRQSIFYSFSGSSGEGVFYRISEFIFSPLTYLAVLSGARNFERAYDMVYIIKIALAAASCAAFINYRFLFGKNIEGWKFELKHLSCIFISVMYAMSSFMTGGGLSVADGMIFLPLMMLGAYKICDDKGAQLLMITTLLSLVSDWYTGLFNSMITLIWFIFELVYRSCSVEGFVKNLDVRTLLARSARYIASQILALGSGAVVWFMSIRLLPDETTVSTFDITTNLPALCILIFGGLTLIAFLFLNNFRYTMKIAVFLTAAVITTISLSPTLMKIITGGEKIDTGSHPVKYAIVMVIVFIFAQSLLTYNSLSKRRYVDIITCSAAGLFMAATLITGVILPVGSRFENEPDKPVSLYTEAALEHTIIGAVRDLDKGTYRIGIVSEDLSRVTLLTSNDDYIYFKDDSKEISTDGDLIGTMYPYAVKYFVSKADLKNITGGDAPLGELEGYSVYLNPYHMPMAMIFNGDYFVEAFRQADAETRLQMSKEAGKMPPTAMSITSKNMKFTCDGTEGQQLFISIPADSHMKIEVNGTTTVPKYYEGLFYTVMLNPGSNLITIRYMPDFFATTALISLIAVVLLMIFVFLENFYDMHYPER